MRVILSAKGGEELREPPGRDLLVRASHTFLHEFHLTGGRTVVMPNPDGFDEGSEGLDERNLTFGAAGLGVGEAFEYIFDLGDDWQHDCTVLRIDVDPTEEYGHAALAVVPIFGWGAIPDQYGRALPDSLDEDKDE